MIQSNLFGEEKKKQSYELKTKGKQETTKIYAKNLEEACCNSYKRNRQVSGILGIRCIRSCSRYCLFPCFGILWNDVWWRTLWWCNGIFTRTLYTQPCKRTCYYYIRD